MGHAFPAPRRTIRKVTASSWVAVLLCLACDPGADAPTLDFPPRPADAPGGTEIARDLRSLEFQAREERVYTEVARGNVPSWLRRLEPVEITVAMDGRRRHVTFWATPDYLSIGSDDDYFYIPLSPGTAQRIAERVGGSLPAPRMIDAIWMSARNRLVPIRIQPGEHMWSVRHFERHNRIIQAQRRQHHVPPGAFVAGHKLDIVLPADPDAGPEHVALYGWHRSDGTPIQPLYRIAIDSPPHFSMGVRLVHREILIDGAEADLAGILRNP